MLWDKILMRNFALRLGRVAKRLYHGCYALKLVAFFMFILTMLKFAKDDLFLLCR